MIIYKHIILYMHGYIYTYTHLITCICKYYLHLIHACIPIYIHKHTHEIVKEIKLKTRSFEVKWKCAGEEVLNRMGHSQLFLYRETVDTWKIKPDRVLLKLPKFTLEHWLSCCCLLPSVWYKWLERNQPSILCYVKVKQLCGLRCIISPDSL